MIELTPWLRKELVMRADLEAPCEAVGLISRGRKGSGREEGKIALWAAENSAQEPETGFLIAAQDQFSLLRSIADFKHDLVGIYHSHPRSGPEPSETDRTIAALWPGLQWVIVGLHGGEAEPSFYVGVPLKDERPPKGPSGRSDKTPLP